MTGDLVLLLLSNSVDHVRVVVSTAQAIGHVERVNRVLKVMLSKVTSSLNHAAWSRILTEVELSINNTPSKLLFGVEQRGAITYF